MRAVCANRLGFSASFSRLPVGGVRCIFLPLWIISKHKIFEYQDFSEASDIEEGEVIMHLHPSQLYSEDAVIDESAGTVSNAVQDSHSDNEVQECGRRCPWKSSCLNLFVSSHFSVFLRVGTVMLGYSYGA